MSRKLSLATLLLLAVPAVATAQPTFELTPFWGYRLGAEFEDFDLHESFELDDERSWGLLLGYNLSRHVQIELLWSHQETVLFEDVGFADLPLYALDVDYYHAGVSYAFGAGQARPFLVATVGVTELDPQGVGFDSDVRFSVGLGGGVKLMFGEHFGLRFELRGFGTDINSDDDHCHCHGDDDGDLWQAEGRVGLVLAF